MLLSGYLGESFVQSRIVIINIDLEVNIKIKGPVTFAREKKIL